MCQFGYCRGVPCEEGEEKGEFQRARRDDFEMVIQGQVLLFVVKTQ